MLLKLTVKERHYFLNLIRKSKKELQNGFILLEAKSMIKQKAKNLLVEGANTIINCHGNNRLPNIHTFPEN